MTAPRTSFVTLDEVTSTPGPTYALTELQVKRDIRHGYLPGKIDHRGLIAILRVEWDAYLSGEWVPAEPGSHLKSKPKKPVARKPGIVSIQREAS